MYKLHNCCTQVESRITVQYWEINTLPFKWTTVVTIRHLTPGSMLSKCSAAQHGSPHSHEAVNITTLPTVVNELLLIWPVPDTVWALSSFTFKNKFWFCITRCLFISADVTDLVYFTACEQSNSTSVFTDVNVGKIKTSYLFLNEPPVVCFSS